MSSLADSAKLVGFFSYSREDDTDSKGALSALREAIQSELSMQLGRSSANFQIWQDKEAIPFGTYWEDRIRRGIGEAAFFIPIITPRVVKSKNCAFEFKAFLERERALGRADLVFPLLYIRVSELEAEEQWRADPVLSIVGTRQYFDWRAMRYKDPRSPEAGARIEQFCNNIAGALTQPWVPPPKEVGDTAPITRQAPRASERLPEPSHEPEALLSSPLVGPATAEIERSEETGLVGAQTAAVALPWWHPSRKSIRVLGALGAAVVVAVWFWFGIRPHDSQRATVSLEPSTTAPPAHSGEAAPPATSGAIPIPLAPVPPAARNDITGSAKSELAAIQPPAASVSVVPVNVDKWAACRPDAQPLADNIGGPAAPATLKLALTPAQQKAIAVRTIAVSPDGKLVVTAGDDAIVRVWQAENLKFVDEMLGHRGPVFAAAFSSDGNSLATASFDGTVQLWDGRTFAHLNTFAAVDAKGPVPQWGVAFELAGNPQYLDSTGEDGNVWIWDLRKSVLAKKVRSSTSSSNPVTGSLSFVPNGNGAFASANFDGTVKFFLEDGSVEVVNAFVSKALRLAYSRNGLLAVAGADALGKSPGVAGVKVWSSPHGFVKAIPSHLGHAASVAWSRDGTRLATGGGFLDPSVALWNPQSGAEVQSFRGHTADVEAVAFHPNQKWLLSGSEDGTIKIWDIAGGKNLLSLVGLPNRDYVAYAPNNCYTGSANAPAYVRFVYKEGKIEHDVTANYSSVFVPTTDVLLSR